MMGTDAKTQSQTLGNSAEGGRVVGATEVKDTSTRSTVSAKQDSKGLTKTETATR